VSVVHNWGRSEALVSKTRLFIGFVSVVKCHVLFDMVDVVSGGGVCAKGPNIAQITQI
jgi:hypothetical protein